MVKTETFVYDEPVVTTQKFRVSLPHYKGRIFVTRKEVKRQLHNMGCTDGLPEGYEDIKVDYEIFAEVSMEDRSRAIEAVEKEIEKGKK